MSGQGHLKIDASVQVFFKSDRDLRDHLQRALQEPRLPPRRRRLVRAAGTEIPASGDAPARTGSHPGSDPEPVGRALFDERGFDFAILHPMTAASILPDWHLGTAILSATTACSWSAGWSRERTPTASAARSASTPTTSTARCARSSAGRTTRVVQIGLPMQTQAPYGRPQFKPLWRAAVDASLPVAIHIEMGAGITHPPTPSGITRTYSHLAPTSR